ncbi:MAG: hypothetical protein JW723_08075, partial [Bacteroidales bacterium]|nr:hypothetical protein [Bacteroidales bacterium]
MVLFSNGIAFSQTTITSQTDGDWDVPATWDLARVPQSGDSVVINHLVEIDLASHNDTVSGITINQNGTLQWAGSANINITTGGVTVNGGALNRNGQAAYLVFVSDNASNYIHNDGSLFNIGYIYISGENSLLYFSGDSSIKITNSIRFTNSSLYDTIIFESSALDTISNDIVFDNDFSEVIIKQDCEVFIGDDIRMDGTNDNNNSVKVESGGSLTVNDDFNFNSCIFNIYNYGTINQGGDFQNASSNEVSCFNYENAYWYYSGSSYDSDLQLYCSYENSTFTYNGGTDQDIYIPRDAYWDLALSGSGDKDLRGNLTVSNDLTISDAAILDANSNNYDITLGGNWNNAATSSFDERNATVIFNGDEDQTITKPGGEEFYNMTSSKSSGSVFLNDSCTVKNYLNLYNGNINTGTDTLFLSDTVPSRLNRYSGHVIGKLKRAVSDTYTGTDYLFPVGNGTTYNPAVLNFTTITNDGNVTAEFIASDPGPVVPPIIEGGVTISNSFDNGYWKLTSGGGFASSDYDISLTANGFDDDVINSATRVIIRPTTGPWDDPIPGDHADASDPVIYRNNVDCGISASGTEFGIGDTDCDIVFTDQPDNLSICSGSEAKFSVTVTGATAWQWQKNGTNLSNGGDISGADESELIISNADEADIGNYACLVTTACGSALSNSASLNISQPFPSLGFAFEKTITVNH